MTEQNEPNLEFDFDNLGNVRCTFLGLKEVNQRLHDFVVESFVVANKTKVMPKQLLDEKHLMLGSLAKIRQQVESNPDPDLQAIWALADQAITWITKGN